MKHQEFTEVLTSLDGIDVSGLTLVTAPNAVGLQNHGGGNVYLWNNLTYDQAEQLEYEVAGLFEANEEE